MQPLGQTHDCVLSLAGHYRTELYSFHTRLAATCCGALLDLLRLFPCSILRNLGIVYHILRVEYLSILLNIIQENRQS